MIKENELRIGNWILQDGKEIRVGIHDFDYLDDNSHPIILSPEILGKAGFEDLYMDEDLHLELYERSELNNNEGYYISSKLTAKPPLFEVFLNSEEYKSSRKVKYVHDLQNLFFSLKGEELPIIL